MLACPDGSLEVQRPEHGWRTQQHQVDVALQQVLVRIQSGELPLLGHVQLGTVSRQAPQAFGDLVAEHVGDGNQLRGPHGTEGLGGGARPPPAASDEPYADQIAAPHMRRTGDAQRASDGSTGQQQRTVLDQRTARLGRITG